MRSLCQEKCEADTSPRRALEVARTRVRWERAPSELGGSVSHQSWAGKCSVEVGWERVPSMLGGNVSHQSWAGTCPVRVG